MSFTSFDPQPLRTREEIAREVHTVSISRGLDELATVIALMTISTEVGENANGNRRWWCPSNPTNDPATTAFPHDSTSDDSRSSGYFQQQPPWWGNAQQRMTLADSADMFLRALPNNYVNAHDAGSAGVFAQLVQGSAYPDRYAEKWDEARDVLARALDSNSLKKELPYDHTITPQEMPFWCGPAAAQVVFNSCGVKLSEQYLAHEIGTTTKGTDYVGLITPVLNRYLPAAKYVDVYLSTDPPTGAEKDRLWGDIVRSIDAGFGVVANIDAPPNNYPQGVKGSVSPTYGGGEVLHYIALMGYDEAYPRAVWVADSGFWPYGYWIGFDQLATLIPPKGYSAATAIPVPTLPVKDLWIQLIGEPENGNGKGWKQLGGRTLVDGVARIGEKLGISDFKAPAGTTNVPFPTGIAYQAKDCWIQLIGELKDGNGEGWKQLGGRTLVDGVARIGEELGVSGFTAPDGPTNVPFPTGISGQIPDLWIQFIGELKDRSGKGWKQLGGHTLVDGVAAIGKDGLHKSKKLGIPGFDPPAGEPNVSYPVAIADQVRDIEIQLLGITGKGWDQLGGSTLVDGIAAIGKKIGAF